MADKTPVRVVFNSSNVATGMAEFQSGETVAIAHGGTGLSSIGSAGQVLKVNAAGNGLEFSGEGDLSITNLVAPSNADLSLRTSGTGGIILNDFTISDNAISTNRSNDDFKINASGSGTIILENLKVGTSGATVTTILDEDNLGSDSATALATQQSIKAYVDANAGGGSSLGDLTAVGSTLSSPSNADLTLQTSGSGNVVVENLSIAGDGAVVTGILDEDAMGSNSNVKLATQQSIKAYVDAQDANIASDTLTFTNKTIDANASGNNISNIDIGNMTAAVVVTESEGIGSNDNDTTLPTSAAVKDYVDNNAGSSTSISEGNSNVTVADSGTGNVTIEVDGTDRLTVTAATTTTATGHTITLGATNTTTGGAIKFLEGTDNGTNTVTLVGPASTGNVTLSLPSATDTLVGKATTDTFTNKTFDVEGTGNSISNIDVADLKSGVLDTDLTSVSGSDDTLASAKAIKTYVDAQVTAQDLDFATDDSTALNIDLDSETLQVSGGANITTSGSGNTITIALDTTLSGLSSVTSTALVTNKISSADSTAVRLDDSLNVDGALDVGGGFTISNTTSVTSIVDEDAMGSNSATALATQQSIKAYVDTQDANIASDTLTLTNKTFDAEGTGNALSNVDVANLKSGVLDTDLSSVSGSDDTLASAKAIKTYVDAQVTAQDLDVAADDSTAIAIDLDSEVLQVSGGSGITTSATGNTITVSLDTALTVNSLVSSDSSSINIKDGLDIDGTLTLASGTGVNNILDEDAMGSNSATSLATQQSIKAYADTKTALTGSTNNQITTVTGAHAIQGESNLTFDGSTLAVTGAVTISGDLTVSGDTTTVSTTNTAIADNILELNTGISQSFNDAGIIIERGTTGNNAAIIWDESADTFVLGTTTATAGDKSGGITIDAGSLKINSLEVDGVTVTDNVITSNSSNADLELNANGSGTVVLENLSVAGDGATVTGILDEDNMASDSNVKLATQQSIKAYADTKAVLSGSTNNQVATVTGAHALTGESNLTFDGSTLGVTGTQTITNTTTNESLTITTTEDSSSAGPVVTLKRNSGSPADADYLGQINFKGENDADQEVLYAKITGKILDASDGTEDGIIEFAHKKAGSTVITGRWRSDSLQLLNGTTLSVNGQITGNVTGDLTGNADTATALATARNIAGQSFDGTASISIASTDLSNTSAIALLTASQTMTNKTLTSPQINTQVDFLARAEARFQDASGGQYVALEAPATVSSSVTFTLPAADGTSGQVLQTDGSGALSFADGGGDGNSPNSTISALPGSEGDFDLSKTNNSGSSETPFEASGTDAFGVNLGSVFSMMDPIGSTNTTDLGSGESHVGA